MNCVTGWGYGDYDAIHNKVFVHPFSMSGTVYENERRLVRFRA